MIQGQFTFPWGFLLLAVLVQSPCGAAVKTFKSAGAWKGTDGKVMPETESRRSLDGFGGWLLVTPDSDWRKEWAKPKSGIPTYKEAGVVKKGETVFVLIFFSNPKLDETGSMNVRCGIKVTRPNQTNSIDQSNVLCADGKVDANPTRVFLGLPAIGFKGEPNDPVGKWMVEVTLIDKNRRASLPLKTSFSLQ